MWNATLLPLVPLVACKCRGFPFWGEDFCLGKEHRGNSAICYLLLHPSFRFNSLPPTSVILFSAPNTGPRIRFVWSLTCLTITPDFQSALLLPAGWWRATKQTCHHKFRLAERRLQYYKVFDLTVAFQTGPVLDEKWNSLLWQQGSVNLTTIFKKFSPVFVWFQLNLLIFIAFGQTYPVFVYFYLTKCQQF